MAWLDDLDDPPVDLTTWLDDLDRKSGEYPLAEGVTARDYGLRWYQREGKAAIEALLRRVRAGLIVMATGLGKTRLGSAVVGDWKDRDILWLAHRDELVQQAAEDLERLTGEPVEIEKAELRASYRARIVVASVQTLAKQKRLERFDRNRFGLIVVDEAHHYIAKTYRRPLDYFNNAKVMGLTATPDRGDRRALGQLFNETAYTFDILQGIEQGYLVPLECYSVRVDAIDISNVGETGGDLVQAQLDEAMVKAVEGVVKETLRLAGERSGILFFPGVKSAELAAQRFNTLKPGSAIFISGETDPDERRELVKAFKAGRYQYLCNCQIATEGFDAPATGFVGMARPTLSRALYAQMLGRGTRTLPGLVDGLDGPELAEARKALVRGSEKPECLVLDFVGNSGKHDLATPEDILGGRFSDAEVKLAKKKALDGAGGNPLERLEAARAELRKVAGSIRSKVVATVERFNPFSVFNMKRDADAVRFGYQPMTAGQLEALKRMGVSKDETRGMNRDDASKLLATEATRRKYNLATYKQLRILREQGVTQINIPKNRASEALTYIFDQRAAGAKTDPLMVQLLLSAPREPGEEG